MKDEMNKKWTNDATEKKETHIDFEVNKREYIARCTMEPSKQIRLKCEQANGASEWPKWAST